MKASELITFLQTASIAIGKDPDVKFYSYEWNDDLEDKDYHKREIDNVEHKDGIIRVFVSE